MIKKFRPYFAMLRPIWPQFLVALVAAAVFGIASGFGIPFVIERVFPVIFVAPPPPTRVVLLYASILPAAFFVRGIASFVNVYAINYCGIRVLRQIQLRLYTKLQHLPLGFFQERKVGDLYTRMLGDTAQLQQTITGAANDLIKQPVTFLGAIGYLVYRAVQAPEMLFVLICLGIIPITVLPIRFTGRRLLRRARQVQEQSSSVATRVHENLTAPTEIRIFNLQDAEVGKFRSALELFQSFQMKVVKYSSAMGPSVEFLSAIGVAVAVFYAAKTGVDVKNFIPLFMALFYCYTPLKSFGLIHNQFKRSEASLDRIEEILQQPVSIQDPETPVEPGEIRGEVEFRNVDFRYSPEESVLEGISERIAPGEIVALVGASGAGKTSFSNLIPRLYDVTGGQVLVDGSNVRDYRQSDLRAQIAIVPQHTVLFNDTIRNNIRLGKPSASNEEIVQAAAKAYAHEFIESFENGYDTMVGDRGARLSGGQRQRIAIARAFLKDAPIVILDEATSALDSESESMIQKALIKLLEGRTAFIIAHRFSTLQVARRVFVFDRGRIVATGSHEALRGGDEIYQALFARQF